MKNTIIISKLKYFIDKFSDKRISELKEIKISKDKFQLLLDTISRITIAEKVNIFHFSEDRINAYFDNLSREINKLIINNKKETIIEIDNEVENIFSILSINYFTSLTSLFDKYKSIESIIMDSEKKTLNLEKRIREGIDNLKTLKENKESELSILEKDYRTKLKAIESIRESLSKEFKNHLNDAKNAQTSLFDKFYSEIQMKSKNLLADMTKKTEEVNKYFNITKSVFDSGSFNLAAAREYKNANVFRIIAFILMTFVAGIMFWLTLKSMEDSSVTTEWYIFLFRFLLVFTLMIPSAYASREANRHRSNAELYTLMAAEMASIDNYVSKLPEEKRILIKEKLAKKYFGHFRLIGTFQNITATDELKKLIKEMKLKSKK